MRLTLWTNLFSLEFRKAITYRMDFWVGFIGTVLCEFAVAYSLWKWIFAVRGVERIGGYDFQSLLLYYLLVSLATNTIQSSSNKHSMSREIYQGHLNRYLVYPVPFFSFKLVEHLSVMLVSMLQMLVMFLLYLYWTGWPIDLNIGWFNLSIGLSQLVLSSVLFFWIASSIELVAFWADNVWSLQVMLKLMVRLLGGAVVPLQLFPESLQAMLRDLPFFLVNAAAVDTAMGKSGDLESIRALCLTIVWIGIFMAVARVVWSRGRYRYTGVGI